ncbi:PfkB family carbohydrate kinase [Aeromicrobium sp. UC242_57]
MATVVRAAEHATGLVVLNPAPPAELPADLVAQVDVLVPNEWELGQLSALMHGTEQAIEAPTVEQAEQTARSLGVRNVVVTLGSRGALVVPQDAAAQRVAPPRVDAVDTTGAGDCFCGALSAALSQGSDLVEATRFAVAAAALSTTAHGARGYLPDMPAVLAQVEPRSKG